MQGSGNDTDLVKERVPKRIDHAYQVDLLRSSDRIAQEIGNLVRQLRKTLDLLVNHHQVLG